MVMLRQAAWATDEECPSCAEEMVLLDDGGTLALAECRACGHRETWATTDRPASEGDAG
jgi:uncharacterized Zn finger protein